MAKPSSKKQWVTLAFTPAQLAAEHGNTTTVVTAH